MGRLSYFKCEFCGKKAHDEFPQDWIHAKSIVIGKGVYTENRVRSFTPEEQQAYLQEWDTTFCSFECLFKWIVKRFGEKVSEESMINPSSAIR